MLDWSFNVESLKFSVSRRQYSVKITMSCSFLNNRWNQSYLGDMLVHMVKYSTDNISNHFYIRCLGRHNETWRGECEAPLVQNMLKILMLSVKSVCKQF